MNDSLKNPSGPYTFPNKPVYPFGYNHPVDQCSTKCETDAGCPTPSAIEYAQDACGRIFDAEFDAIEKEIIKAREKGYLEGYEDGYKTRQEEIGALRVENERLCKDLAIALTNAAKPILYDGKRVAVRVNPNYVEVVSL